VTAQLILMEPEHHVWAQSYDCEMSAVLSTQRDAAREIAACIATALIPGGGVAPAPVPSRPVAPEIVDAYLMARSEWGKMNAEGIGKALQYLREITVKAPDFAGSRSICFLHRKPGLLGARTNPRNLPSCEADRIERSGHR
jgi:adenylate cyclase